MPPSTASPVDHAPDPVVRTVAEEEFAEWLRGTKLGFHRLPEVSSEELAARLPHVELDRTWGAFEGARAVGALRTMPRRLTVPGGGELPADAVTQVSVLPTHRRRGLLSRMVARSLAAARERGDACAILVAAEYPIYGRFGFGPATATTEFEVEIARSGLDPRYGGPEGGARVELVDAQEAYTLLPEIFDRFRGLPERQGAIDRPDYRWRTQLALANFPGAERTPTLHAVHRDASGTPQGAVAYTVDEHWEAKLPCQTAQVHDLFAVTPEAERALWRHVLSLDWVARVRSGTRAPDDVLPLLLPDPRAARTLAHADFLWLRPLDVPRMLGARRYAGPGSLVLDVRDTAGLAGGRFRLDAGAEGAACTPTREEAELSLDVGELGALYLGGESAVRLASVGRVVEERAGAALAADALFRTSRQPWCPDLF